MDDRLHRAVYGPLDRPQSLPQPVCRLMMGAVHHQGLSEKVLQGRGGCPYPVEPVPTRRLAVAGQVGSESYMTLLLGTHGGVLGETCAITILIGGIFLIATKVISPTIPVTYLATVAVLSLVAGEDPIYQLLSGGLLLGAFFMATDYVTSPTTTKGKLIFGLGLGIITCAIRFLGTMAEGVSFSILLMNLTVPYIEVLTRQDRLGIAKVKKNKEGAGK